MMTKCLSRLPTQALFKEIGNVRELVMCSGREVENSRERALRSALPCHMCTSNKRIEHLRQASQAAQSLLCESTPCNWIRSSPSKANCRFDAAVGRALP